MPGLPELLIVVLLIVLLFGASRIPQLGRSLGRAGKEFKAGLKEGDVVAGPCPFCSTDLTDGAKFCSGCGRPAGEIVSERMKRGSAPA
ncbi:MAG: twin-arginine translocase TatA/TatE family subunit [Actinomycetota bacterium]